MPRTIVFVSGAPGSGKTTLAHPLAEELGLPLFAKDTIKETVHDVMGGDEPLNPDGSVPLSWSNRLGSVSMELLWTLAQNAPACVLEANFRPAHARQRERLSTLTAGGRLVEVHCACPPEEAARRFDLRGTSPGRHPVHIWRTLPAAARAQYTGPLALGPVIEVDTTRPVDVVKVAARVFQHLGL
jgi:predicted kinase